MTPRYSRWLVSLYNSPWTAVTLVAVVGFMGALNHSMWRDEMNVWLIARDSPSFGALIENIHYDRAHPGLWHLLVAILEQLFDNPIAMQIFHWLLAVGSILLIWQCSPFTQTQKWLITFGHLPFYEHLLIARNYAVAMLLLFTICAVWPSRKRAYWPLAILLVLLANSNIYALIIAIALALTLGLELLFEAKLRRNWLDIGFSGLLIILGCAISLYFIVPPSDVADKALGEYFLTLDLRQLLKTIGRIFAGYYTIVPNGKRYLDLVVCAALSLASCGLVLLHLARKPYAVAFYLFSNGAILGFTYIKFMAYLMRHVGNIYLVLIAALWLAHHYPPSSLMPRRLPLIEPWITQSRRWFKRMLIAVLITHLAGGLYGFTRDMLVPYSASRAAAAYMREANLQDAFIVASRDAQMAPLSGLLRRPFYYPERQMLGSYTLFFKGDRREVSQPEVLQQVSTLLSEQPQILLILTKELEIPAPGLVIEPIQSFTQSWTNEEYYLYWVSAAQ